jgi:hypothetical protein
MEESSKSKKSRRERGKKISNFSLNERWNLEKLSLLGRITTSFWEEFCHIYPLRNLLVGD